MRKIAHKITALIFSTSAAALLSACNAHSSSMTTAPAPAATHPERSAPIERCNARAIDDLIGQPWRAELLEAARVRANADMARQLWTDSIITKEYRFGRLNIVVDRQTQRIAHVSCG